MPSGWDHAKEVVANQSGDDLFFRLKDGEKFIVAFVGEPHARQVVWNDALGRTEAYDPHRHKDTQPSTRFALNVFVPATGKMRVFDCGVRLLGQIAKLRDKYTLESRLFEIERNGSDKQTTYTLLPDEKIDAELRQRIAATQLHDLEALFGRKPNNDATPSRKPRSVDERFEDDDIPF